MVVAKKNTFLNTNKFLTVKKKVDQKRKRIISKKRVAKKRIAKKRIAKKRIAKKRIAKKRISKKRIAKKRVAKKRVAKKRVAKKRVVKNSLKRKNIVVKKQIVKKQPYQHFIIMRFSLAFAKGAMKPIRKTLAASRLKQKFAVFQRICLPSLARQKQRTNVTIIIRITDNLPAIWKKKLHNLTNKYNFIHIQEFNHRVETYGASLDNKHLKPYLKEDTKLIATTRIDDDDALAPNFTAVLSRYINTQYINKIISFPRGYVLDTKSKKYFLNSRRLLALGLTLIQKKDNYGKFNKGVYSTNHTQWGKKTKCFYPRNIMYIRTRHGVNDSSMSSAVRIKLARGNKNLGILRRQFSGIII